MLLVLLSTWHLSVAVSSRDAGLEFSGRVQAGHEFVRRMPTGLFFCLEPVVDRDGETSGWLIKVGPACGRESANYAAVVTPPLHGPNAILIDAWNFDAGANALKELRDFNFVLTNRDYVFMMNELSTYTDPGSLLTEFDEFGRGKGTLTITGMARHKTAKGESVFDWLQFRATLR